MFDFSGQVVLVTGASRGIGECISRRFCERGARVFLAARSENDLKKVTGSLVEQGFAAEPLVMDVGDKAQIERGAAHVLETAGKLDVLVNNAGITRDNLVMRMKDEDWETVIAVNLSGSFYLTRAFLPSMIRQRFGRIVNIVSVVGQMGNAGQANYVSSKAGLIGLTKSLAREVASRSITVNAVAPGYIETDMTGQLGEKVRQSLLDTIPVRRIGTVDEIASGVQFLASKEAGYITGHVLNINGGMFM